MCLKAGTVFSPMLNTTAGVMSEATMRFSSNKHGSHETAGPGPTAICEEKNHCSFSTQLLKDGGGGAGPWGRQHRTNRHKWSPVVPLDGVFSLGAMGGVGVL